MKYLLFTDAKISEKRILLMILNRYENRIVLKILLEYSDKAFNTLLKNEGETAGSINNLLLGTWTAISMAITFISDHLETEAFAKNIAIPESQVQSNF